MIKSDPSVNIVLWQAAIDRQVKSAEKYPMVEIDSVPITQNELDICDCLSGRQSKLKKTSKRDAGVVRQKSSMGRLMFTLICLAKYGNMVNNRNNGWVNRKDSEIFRLANISTSSKRQSSLLSDLRDEGYIRFSKKVDNININVTCLDEDGDPALAITDYRNLGNQYLRYCGKPFFECASCGLVVRRKNNSQLYCPDCKVIMNRKHARENYRSLTDSSAS